MRVLLIDDAETARLAMADYFRARGYATACARSVDEAQTLQSAEPYDAVIFDLNDAEQSTTEALDQVAKMRSVRLGTRVVVLVANEPVGVPEQMNVHRGHVVVKPLGLPDLEHLMFS
jgi:response regulator RpfG family c-di-GMP phosphodiesterase